MTHPLQPDSTADTLTHLHTLQRRSRTAETPLPDDVSADTAHLRLIDEILPTLAPTTVLSSSSAAVLHGLWVPADDLHRVHVTRVSDGGGRRDPRLHSYNCPLTEDEIVVLDGRRVTSLARTTVDCMRHLRWRQVLAVGDSALRRGCTTEAMTEVLNRHPRRPGNVKARAALPWLDGKSETAGESVSRAVFFEFALPSPELQVEIRDAGTFVARVDFLWRRYRLIGEFDGNQKYVDPIMATSPALALRAQEERDTRLRAMGYTVLHWTSADLRRPEKLITTLQEHMRAVDSRQGRRELGFASTAAARLARDSRGVVSEDEARLYARLLGGRPVRRATAR